MSWRSHSAAVRCASQAAPDGVDAAAAAPPSAVPTAAAPSSSAFIRQKLREDEASRAAAEAAARAASLEKRALQELVAAREEAQRHALIRERSARGAAELARPSSARSSRASVGANSAAADTAVTGDAGWFTRSRRGSSASTASTFSVFSSLRGLAAKGGTRVGASAAATTSGTGGGGGDRDADGKRSVGFSDIQEEHPAVKGGRKALKRPASAAVQRRRPLSAAAARRIPPPTDAASEVGTVDTAPALVRRGPEAQRRPPLKSALKRPQSAMPATRAARLGGGTGTGDVGGGGGGVGARGGQGGRAKLPTMAMLRAYSGMLDGATGGGRKELPPLKEHITSRSAFYRAKEEARRAVAARASRSGMLNDETELSGTRALRLTMTSMRLAERNKLRLANKPANGSDDGDSGSDDEVPSVIEGSVVRRRKSRRPQSAKARSSSTVLAVADVSSSALTVSNTARERKPGGPGGLDAYVDAIVEETSEADGSDAGSHQDATSEKGQADADAEPEEHVPTLSEAAAAAAAEAQAALQGATSRRRMRPVLSMTAMAPPSRGLDGAPRPLRLDKRGALRALLGASNAKSARITRTGYGKATSSGGGAAVASEKKEDGDTAHRGDSTATNAPNAAAATPAKQRRESSSSSSSGSSSSGSDGDGARVVKFAEETKAQDGTVTATRGGAGGDPATSRELAKARATQAKRDATARLRAGTQRDAEVAAASLESASAVQRMKRGTAADKRVILNWMEAAKITAVKPVRLLVRRKPPPSGMPAYQVSYASVGATLAIASGAGYVRVWDLPTHPGRRQELRRQLDIPHGAILAVCFSPDDSMVAAAGAEGVLRVWAVDTGKLLGRCYYHLERLMTVHWAPDNSRIVTSGADRTLGTCAAPPAFAALTTQHCDYVHACQVFGASLRC